MGPTAVENARGPWRALERNNERACVDATVSCYSAHGKVISQPEPICTEAVYRKPPGGDVLGCRVRERHPRERRRIRHEHLVFWRRH